MYLSFIYDEKDTVAIQLKQNDGTYYVFYACNRWKEVWTNAVISLFVCLFLDNVVVYLFGNR